jgi:hypothetical protein
LIPNPMSQGLMKLLTLLTRLPLTIMNIRSASADCLGHSPAVRQDAGRSPAWGAKGLRSTARAGAQHPPCGEIVALSACGQVDRHYPLAGEVIDEVSTQLTADSNRAARAPVEHPVNARDQHRTPQYVANRDRCQITREVRDVEVRKRLGVQVLISARNRR